MRPLGASWGLLGASWGFLGASEGGRFDFSVFGSALGSLWGSSWGPLGPSWVALGPSLGLLGPSWDRLGGLLGRLGTVLEAPWAILESRKAGKSHMLKMYISHRNSTILASRGPLVRPLGALLGRLRGLLGRLEAILGVFGRSLGVLGPPWPVLEPSWARGPSQRLTRNTPAAPKSTWEFGRLGPKETTILGRARLHEARGTPLRAEGTVADLKRQKEQEQEQY